jgi:hypothetical protein
LARVTELLCYRQPRGWLLFAPPIRCIYNETAVWDEGEGSQAGKAQNQTGSLDQPQRQLVNPELQRAGAGATCEQAG